jgi:hypothetical protein
MAKDDLKGFISGLNKPLYWTEGFEGFARADGRKVTAVPYGFQDIIVVGDRPLSYEDGKYLLPVGNFQQWLDRDEINEIFGVNDDWKTGWPYVAANIEASQSGSKGANAYVLGPAHHISRGEVIFPVMYLKLLSDA